MGDPWSQEPRNEQEPPASSKLNAEVRYNEDADRYEIGFEADGAWVVFTAADGATVRSVQENAKTNAAAEASSRQAAGVGA